MGTEYHLVDRSAPDHLLSTLGRRGICTRSAQGGEVANLLAPSWQQYPNHSLANKPRHSSLPKGRYWAWHMSICSILGVVIVELDVKGVVHICAAKGLTLLLSSLRGRHSVLSLSGIMLSEA